MNGGGQFVESFTGNCSALYFRKMTGKYFIAASFTLVLFTLSGCKSKKGAESASKGIIRKKMLVAAEIEAIKILTLPRYAKDGEAWDAYAPFATDPDPFLVIRWNEAPIFQSETLDNLVYGTATELTRGLPHKLTPFDQTLLLEVFDEDRISGDDNIGYMNFKPSEFHGKPVILLTQGELQVELKMKWYYE